MSFHIFDAKIARIPRSCKEIQANFGVERDSNPLKQ